MRTQKVVLLSIAARSFVRCFAVATSTLGVAMCIGVATAQVQPSVLNSVDLYRTTQIDRATVEERWEPAIRALLAAFNANDEAAMERLYPEIIESIEASGDFAYISLDMTTGFVEESANPVYASIEVVDEVDAAERLSFDPKPTGSIDDPSAVLEAWGEYQRIGFELLQTRAIFPALNECPAHHCFVGFDHEVLSPFLMRFDLAASEQHDELVRVLREDRDANKRAHAAFVLAHIEDPHQLVRDLVPSLDDPASVVRNNVMRVLLMVAQEQDAIDIPFGPITRRIDDPDSGCRNKAAYLIAALASRPEYRDQIVAIAPSILRLLRLKKPNNHDPAYEILKTISGAEFGERDYDRWEEWIQTSRPVNR